MPKRNFSTLEEFKANIHKEGATLVEFSGTKVPCILLSQKKYEQLLHKVYDKKVRADTLLDIFYDRHNVFVDVQVKLLDTDFEQNFLLYANDMVEFFEALALILFSICQGHSSLTAPVLCCFLRCRLKFQS